MSDSLLLSKLAAAEAEISFLKSDQSRLQDLCFDYANVMSAAEIDISDEAMAARRPSMAKLRADILASFKFREGSTPEEHADALARFLVLQGHVKLSAARQSDSCSAPEPTENRFDSDATDQLASEERMHRFDDALRADYSLQDALDFNLAAKAAGGTA